MDRQIRLDSVDRAISDIAAGPPVVVVDDADRENEGDIIFAAQRATPELLAFTIRHSSGVICAPMAGEWLDRLAIPLMTPHHQDPLRTAYTVSVDARAGVTTGISAADRARTLRALADPASMAADLNRPGHVFPLRYRDGGVLVRRGHTEAAADLAELAGLAPVGVLVELVDDDGTMTRGAQLRAFADTHGLAMIGAHGNCGCRTCARGRAPTDHNAGYLGAKRDRMGHALPKLGPVAAGRAQLAGVTSALETESCS